MIKIACRKNLTALSDAQRTSLVNALLSLKSQGKYDKYADQHHTYFGSAHGNPFFYPWHRKFLGNLEKELREIDPDIALPYWDWRTSTSTTALPWTSAFMGGTGNPVSGPFEPWGIGRSLGVGSSLPSATTVSNNQALTPYSSHWGPAEDTHGPPHGWVGGNMVTTRSPEDPVFFMHHCFVDKWWSDWQLAHPLEDTYQGTGGNSPTSPMPPWSTTPNDVLDTLALDYVYDTDPPRIELQTTSLTFVDVPEGEETVRGVTFEVVTCELLTFNITAGPGSDFGTPFGTSVTVDPGDGAVRGDAIVWISYQGTNDGDTASGSVTVECPQTGESWVVPISANTINRPTVGVALVLDKSSSMNVDIGDGRSRNDLLIYAANVFANVIHEDNGLGIAAFDHDANKLMDITDAGPPIFGMGRSQAITHIANHTPNPNGYTSIGDGVEVGNTLITAAAAAYDERAMLVFTDGKENRSKFIADVAGLIGDRVFAIGLGTAADLNAAALAELCNNSGGELLLTDTIDPMDDYFKLSKYYLQILAGITNVDIVTDPEDWIKPGEVHRIPFDLNETDVSHDVVLLCPAANVIGMTLETPTGDVIDPAFASSAIGVTYVPGETFSYYRVTLPVVGAAGNPAKEGSWTAVLKVNPKYFDKWLSSLDNSPDQMNQAKIHGVRYNLSVYALSNLRLRGTLSQNSYEPGAQLSLRCSLTEYGLPLRGQATMAADLTRPDGSTMTLPLPKVETGIYEAQITATMSGIYTAHAKAVGKTERNRDFTREHIFTGAVWKGGDDPFPTTGVDPDENVRCLCSLLRCLLGSKVLTGQFEERLAKEGIDLNRARKCIEAWCDCRLGRSGERKPAATDLTGRNSKIARDLKANPEMVTLVSNVLAKLLEDRGSS